MAPQTSVSRQIDSPPRPGTCLGQGRDVGSRAGGKAAKIVQLVVDQERNTHDYVLDSLGGYDEDGVATTESALTYTSDGSGTKPEINAGLIGVVEANANALRRVNPYPHASSTDTFFLEGRQPGDDFDFAETDDDLTATVTQSAADDAAIPFGAGVCRVTGTEDVCLPSLDTTAAVAAVAQVHDLEPTPVNNARYLLIISGDFDGDGLAESYPFEFLADASATAAEIVDALVADINAQMPASSILAANSADKLRLTAEVAGTPFEARGSSDDATATWTITEVTANVVAVAASYALTRPFAGIAGAAPVEQTPVGSGPLEHPAGSGLPVRIWGPIQAWIEPGISPATTDSVYLRCVTSGTKLRGMLSNTLVAGETILIPELAWSTQGQTGDFATSAQRTAGVFVEVK